MARPAQRIALHGPSAGWQIVPPATRKHSRLVSSRDPALHTIGLGKGRIRCAKGRDTGCLPGKSLPAHKT